MPFRSVTFPITLARATDPMILGARMAVADILRAEAKAALGRANEAGVDAVTLGQRMVMSYMAACRGSRFLRGFPGPVARWCFQVEQHAVQLAGDQYPPIGPMTIGGYGQSWVTMMPHRNVLVSAGGVRASGVLAEGDEIVNHEIREVRLSKTLNNDATPGWSCQVIMSNDVGSREGLEDPTDVAPPVLEPEDM